MINAVICHAINSDPGKKQPQAIYLIQKNLLGKTPEPAEYTLIVVAVFTGFMEKFLGHGKCVTDKRIGWCLMLGTMTELTWAQLQVSARAVLRH